MDPGVSPRKRLQNEMLERQESVMQMLTSDRNKRTQREEMTLGEEQEVERALRDRPEQIDLAKIIEIENQKLEEISEQIYQMTKFKL